MSYAILGNNCNTNSVAITSNGKFINPVSFIYNLIPLNKCHVDPPNPCCCANDKNNETNSLNNDNNNICKCSNQIDRYNCCQYSDCENKGCC